MRQEIREQEVGRTYRRAALAAALFLAPAAANASFLSGEALDTAANVLSWVILVFVPLGAIGLFWYVHILPEVIAEKRHHPQKDAIKTLCILSLFFGGLLWPFAWLWAYTRPIGFRMAYGSEKHEDYYLEEGERARNGLLTRAELAHLRDELDGMAERGVLPAKLRQVRADVDAMAEAPQPAAAAIPAPAPDGKA